MSEGPGTPEVEAEAALHQIAWACGVPPWLFTDYEPSRSERVVWWFRVRWVDWRSS